VHCNHTLLYYVCELTIEKLTDTVDDETYEELVEEIHSMILLADLSGLNMMHHTKHLVQGWWQATTINELKQLLRKFPWLKGIITDYKNKLLPRMKNEPMSLFFSKSGISILGNMAMWAGWKTIRDKRIEGLFVWFIDIIWQNTSSQRAKDMLPGFAAILDELAQPYLVERAGVMKGVFVLSGNAFVSTSNSAFFNAFNQYGRRAGPAANTPSHKASLESDDSMSVEFPPSSELSSACSRQSIELPPSSDASSACSR
jgi:hypothetical protein